MSSKCLNSSRDISPCPWGSLVSLSQYLPWMQPGIHLLCFNNILVHIHFLDLILRWYPPNKICCITHPAYHYTYFMLLQNSVQNVQNLWMKVHEQIEIIFTKATLSNNDELLSKSSDHHRNSVKPLYGSRCLRCIICDLKSRWTAILQLPLNCCEKRFYFTHYAPASPIH